MVGSLMFVFMSKNRFHPIIIASSGMLATESRVEMNVPWAIAVSSRPYFMQNIVPN